MLSLLLPQRCCLCDRFLNLGERDLCERCALPDVLHRVEPELEGLPRFAAAELDDAIRDAIHRVKFGRDDARAAGLGRAIARNPELAVELGEVDLVVPVPLSRGRLRERGFNQAALLARPVARALGVPMRARALRRTRETARQATLDAAGREQIFGAFRAAGVEGLRVLVVDDVTTTGSTLLACAEALCEAGAREWIALSLAWTP